MTQLTRGPWALEQIDADASYVSAYTIADADRQIIFTIVPENGVNFACVLEERDAHLIAAAPELYAALAECLRYGAGHTKCEQSYLLPPIRDMAEDALKKARGEA